MQEDPTLTAGEVLDGAAYLGHQRCQTEDEFGSAALFQGPPAWDTQRADLLRRQLDVLGGQGPTISLYVELLARAYDLAEFVRHNVGNTEDWPIMLLVDSDTSGEAFQDKLRRLEHAVGVLIEV